MDHHQGVLLVLAKLLIKNYKIKVLKVCIFGDAAAYLCYACGGCQHGTLHTHNIDMLPHRRTYKPLKP